jgi:RNA polymerase sigma-70 factor (ECF subfamily)
MSRPERKSCCDIIWRKKTFFLSHFCLELALNGRSASMLKGPNVRTDAELVNAVSNGEKQAFALLVERYERPVRAVALDVLGDYHSAADVSQDAFLKAYDRLAGLRKPEAFGPWLMRITRRCALDSARREPKETQLEAEIAAVTEGPNGQFDENTRRLLAAVIRLPKAEKQVVMLRYFGDNSVKDVARIVERSVGTVTKQLSRAHKRLRNLLEGPEK